MNEFCSYDECRQTCWFAKIVEALVGSYPSDHILTPEQVLDEAHERGTELFETREKARAHGCSNINEYNASFEGQ